MTEEPPKPPQRQALEEQDRLADILDGLRDDDDDLRFVLDGRRVVCFVASPADDDIGEGRPGQWIETPDLSITGEGRGTSLSIWVWEGVPRPFKKVVLYHEVTEGILKLNYGIRKHEAHLIARRHHEEYARARLTPEQLEEFAQWDARLEHGTSEYDDE